MAITNTMTDTQVKPDAFALIGMALEAIGEHDTSRECDTPEMARALGFLSQARDLLRVEAAQPRYSFEQFYALLGQTTFNMDLMNVVHAVGALPMDRYWQDKFQDFKAIGHALGKFDAGTMKLIVNAYVEARRKREAGQ